MRDFDLSPIASALPVNTWPVVVPTPTDWAERGVPSPFSEPIVMLRPLLPIAMPTLMTSAFWLLCSPLLMIAACLIPVLAASPTAPALPVFTALLIVPIPGVPAPPAPTTFWPLFECATPTLTTSAICRMSIAPLSVVTAWAFWSIALALSVPVAFDLPVCTLPSAVFGPVAGVFPGASAVAALLPEFATAVPSVPTAAFWSLLFCGGPGAPAGVEGVGSAWAPLGGGALCVSAGGGVELELSAGAGGPFAGGAVAGGGAVDSGGGVDDCSGGGV